MLQNAFNININEKDLEEQTKKYMMDVATSVSADTTEASKDFSEALNKMCYGIINEYGDTVTADNIDSIVENYLNEYEPSSMINSLEEKYLIPRDNFRTVFSGLLKGLLQLYVNTNNTVDPDIIQNIEQVNSVITPETIAGLNAIVPELGNRMTVFLNDVQTMNLDSVIIPTYLSSTPIQGTITTMASVMTEAVMKKEVLTKMGDLTRKFGKYFSIRL